MQLTTVTAAVAILFASNVSAINIFEQMFGQQGNPHQQHQQQQQQDMPSDSNWYQSQFAAAHCSRYLCPKTLACVHFPHHCPCAFPALEDKVELGEGSSVCASKGGFKIGETARKIELARKGLL